MNRMKSENEWYWELIAVCQTNLFELISFYLFESGVSGIEELSIENNNIRFKVFIPSSIEEPDQLLPTILGQAEVTVENVVVVSFEKRAIQNCQESWRDHFKPVEIGDSFAIRPPWEESQTGKKEIIIYPGQGFGTGYHESTHLALLLIEWLLKRYQIHEVTDIGTGSGVLTIAALLMEIKHVTAVDIDREALLEVPKNIELSGLKPKSVSLIQCGPEALKNQTELVMANIEGHILEALSHDLKRLVHPNGYLLLSGILIEFEASLIEAFQDSFTIVKTLKRGEWSGFIMRKNP